MLGTKRVTLQRDDKVIYIVLRSDEAPVVGRKFKYGSGRCWTVLAVESN